MIKCYSHYFTTIGADDDGGGSSSLASIKLRRHVKNKMVIDYVCSIAAAAIDYIIENRGNALICGHSKLATFHFYLYHLLSHNYFSS